jgi:hypothetical protein
MLQNHLSLKDLFLTPLYLALILAIAFIIARTIKNEQNRKYFFRGIVLKLVGGILFGIVYATIYRGDTSLYWKYGTIIGDAFWDSPGIWLKLILRFPVDTETIPYLSKIPWYNDHSSYFTCQITGLLAPFCFNTYSVIVLFFGLLSFNGLWHLFLVFNNLYPTLHSKTALSLFYLPSLVFWGSGIMKDPLVLTGLGWITYAFYFGLIKRQSYIKCFLLAFFGMYVLFSVKPYVIACFFPPMLLWLYTLYLSKIPNVIAKIVFSSFSVLVIVGIMALFFSRLQASSGQNIQDLNSVTNQISQSSQWISSISGEQGSSYSLGVNDGTVVGSLSLFPQAVFTSLFRPFLWEAKNISTLLAALESSWFIFITVTIFYKVGLFESIKIIYKDKTIMFCFIFAMIFSFIVGISSGNFGTLVRYKIPMMPFYINSIFAIWHTYQIKKSKSPQ